MHKILIATTNIGKFNEITAEFSDLLFTFVSLRDVGLDTAEVDEPHATTTENALEKARFFAKKSGLMTISEDTGLFIKHLKGNPGVHTKRYGGGTLSDSKQKVLKELKGVRGQGRQAYFETSVCFYNPTDDNFSVFKGVCKGLIAEKESGKAREGMGYDTVFYYPPAKKLFSQMSLEDKNLVSHRGKALIQLKHHISRQLLPKQIICSVSIVVKDRKMLLLKRRDHRPTFNNKWEFPGGGVEFKETPEISVLRETKEETGYNVEIVEQIPQVYTIAQGEKSGNYQVFLILFICKIKSGSFKTSDTESAGHGWFTYNEVIKLPSLPLNKKCVQDNKALLKNYID